MGSESLSGADSVFMCVKCSDANHCKKLTTGKGGTLPKGAVSMTTGGRKDHWFLIMFGGVGPDSVGRPPIMSSANLKNSCSFRHKL